MTAPAFDEADIRTLVCHPQTSKRAGAAQRLCETFRSQPLTASDRRIAERLLRAMAKDAAQLVRAALVVTLHNSPELPRDVAVRLAEDVDSIAVPIIHFSPVLTDDDLVTVLRSRAAAKIRACARRARVSVDVARTIIRFGDGPAVADLAANDGAQIDEGTAREMVRLWHDDDLVAEAMVRRRDMPLDILETLIAHSSVETVLSMTERGACASSAIDIAQRTHERATLAAQDDADADSALGLARHMHGQGRLSGSLILRAICSGQIEFAERAFAAMSGLGVGKTRLLLHDDGPMGVATLAARAGIAHALHPVIGMAMRLHRELQREGVESRDAYTRSLAQRLMTSGVELDEDDRRYVFERMDALAA